MKYDLAAARLIILLTAVCLWGCSSLPEIERVHIDAELKISGRWNDIDSNKVSGAMIADCLNSPWSSRYSSSHRGKRPDVIIGRIFNRSHEHINIQTFIKDLERALIQSERVCFVASQYERGDIRAEREDMAIHSSVESFKGPGHEAGADYMLKGYINSIIDEAGGRKVVYYQVNLDLSDMSTNRKVWSGCVKIKKLIKRAKYTW